MNKPEKKRNKDEREEREEKKEESSVLFLLPFSTLEHHWWHVQPLKLLANRLSSFALSPRIIGVKGRCASQLMSQRASVPLSTPQTPTIQWDDGETKQTKKEIFSAAACFDSVDVLCGDGSDAENLFSFLKTDRFC